MATKNTSNKKGNKTNAPAAVVDAALNTLPADNALVLHTPEAIKGNAAMNFAMQQLTTPEVKLEDTAEFKAALAAKVAETLAASAPKDKPVRTPRATLLQQNGETRPGATTIGGRIWAAIDAAAATAQRPITIAEAKAIPELKDDLVVNVQSIYARWRKFNGVVGRLTMPATVAATPEPAMPGQQAADTAPTPDV